MAAAAEPQTYHCLCTNLLLSTTHPLSALPRRAPPALDHAYILPCPPPPPQLSPSPASEAAVKPQTADAQPQTVKLLPGLAPAARPLIVQREDGFEKRWVLRCARCGLAVGYQLDWGQSDGEGERGGRRGDVVYVLPGAVVTTEQMVRGERPGKGEVELVEGGGG